MKESPLNPAHSRLGAHMEEVDGWRLPRSFRSLMEEHLAARSSCAVFDISYISKFCVLGNGALSWLEGIFGRAVSTCHDGACVRAQLLGARGKAVDTFALLRESAGRFLLLGHAAAEEQALALLSELRTHAALELRQVTDQWCAMAITGPQAQEVLSRTLRGIELPAPQRFTRFTYQRHELILAQLTLHEYAHSTPLPATYELLCPALSGISWYESLITAGAQPCGSATREILRMKY